MRARPHHLALPHHPHPHPPYLNPARACSPLALYHTIVDSHYQGENYSAAEYHGAGFNTLHFWPALPLKEQVAWAKANGFQAIPQIGTSANASEMSAMVAPFASSDSVLGWFLAEEPTGSKACFVPSGGGAVATTCTTAWSDYLATKQGIKAVDTTHAIFNLDCAWADKDNAGNDPREWWRKWNSDADLSVHDNYPFPGCNPSDDEYRYGWSTLARKQGITDTVPLAVNITDEKKPVWLTIQAFAQPGGPNFWFAALASRTTQPLSAPLCAGGRCLPRRSCASRRTPPWSSAPAASSILPWTPG